MSTEIKGYRPLSRESTDRITKAWKWYRENMGLEGDKIAMMKKNGASKAAIRHALETHREDRSDLIELFQEVKIEIGIGSNKQPEEKE